MKASACSSAGSMREQPDLRSTCVTPLPRKANVLLFGHDSASEKLIAELHEMGGRCVRSYWSGSYLQREYRV